MYLISMMQSGKWFGEHLFDGYYCEGDTYFEVSEKLSKHDEELNNIF